MSKGKSSDPIQNDIDECCANLQKTISTAQLIITHFLCGSTTKADTIRKSSIYMKSATVENGRPHADALRDHIRHLDRRNTILSIIENWAERQDDALMLSINKNNSSSILFNEKTEYNVKAYGLSLPPDIIDSLCPENLGKDYMEKLYKPNLEVDGGFKQRFLLRRAAAFGNILHDTSSKKAICEFMTGDGNASSEDSQYEELLWKLLGGLQSSLLYFLNCENEKWSFDSNAEFIIYKTSLDKDKSFSEMMIAVILTPKANLLTDVDVNHVIKELRSIYDKKITYRLNFQWNEPYNNFNPSFEGEKLQAKDRVNNFIMHIKDLFSIDIRKSLAATIGTWVIWLLEYLEGSVHEGQHLDFWFVIGDLTQFGDCKWIEFRRFRELKEEDYKQVVHSLGIPLENSTIDENKEAIKNAAKFVAKEHFPWFQGGKYALFWDVSRVPSKDEDDGHIVPFGLVRICGSSWEQYLEQSYTDTQHIRLPANVLVYTKGIPMDSGLIANNIDQNDNFTQQRVLTLKKKKWSPIEIDGRNNKLYKILTDELFLHEKLQEKIVGICLRVADNPAEGGTLVVLKKGVDDYKTIFTPMGIPWKFSDHTRDREDLVCHDGATIIQEGNNADDSEHWDFRFLLSAHGIKQNEQQKLVDWVHNKSNKPGENCPLSGAGARRWSAALTSLHEVVLVVIVISQDGDISCWIRTRDKKRKPLPEVKILHLRQGMINFNSAKDEYKISLR